MIDFTFTLSDEDVDRLVAAHQHDTEIQLDLKRVATRDEVLDRITSIISDQLSQSVKSFEVSEQRKQLPPTRELPVQAQRNSR